MAPGLLDPDAEPSHRRLLLVTWLMVVVTCVAVRWNAASGAIAVVSQVGLVLSLTSLFRTARALLQQRRRERRR